MVKTFTQKDLGVLGPFKSEGLNPKCQEKATAITSIYMLHEYDIVHYLMLGCCSASGQKQQKTSWQTRS